MNSLQINWLIYFQTFEGEKKGFYDDEDDEAEKASNDDDEEEETPETKTYIMDSDHRLLLRCTKPLLQSRNSAVGFEYHQPIISIVWVDFFCIGSDGCCTTILLPCTTE